MVKLIIAVLLLASCLGKAETLELSTRNTVTFRGEVTTESVAKAEYALINLIAKRGAATYPIYLVLDSPGGDIDAGNDFIQFAKTYSNIKTLTIFAASMAAGIVEHLPGQRLITENGVLMFHRAKGGISGQFEDGELESRLNFIKTIVRNMEQKNADRIGLSLQDYKSKVKDEWWLVSKDSVAQGAADKVVDVSCTPELLNGKEVLQVQSLFFQLDVEYSNCPLLRGGKVLPPKKEKESEQ